MLDTCIQNDLVNNSLVCYGLETYGTDYLAQLKSMPFVEELKPNDILITSDTIVWFDNKALGKPIDTNEAFQMLKSLSGHTHEVITSVCFKSVDIKMTLGVASPFG